MSATHSGKNYAIAKRSPLKDISTTPTLPASTGYVSSVGSGGHCMESGSAATLVHDVVSSRIDYCNVVRTHRVLLNAN